MESRTRDALSALQQQRLCRWQRFHVLFPQYSSRFPAMLLSSMTLAVLPRRAAPAAVWASLHGSQGRAPNPEQLKKPKAVCRVRCSKATLCSNLAGGPSQTHLPKDKRESFETPVVSLQRKMCRGRGREGVGEKPMKLCRLRCWMQLCGSCGRCLWSSSWHQVCPKLWQTAEHRALFQTLQPLLRPSAELGTIGHGVQGRTHCSRRESPSKEMQPPSLHRGRRKEAGRGICFAAGRAAVQQDSPGY